jgi:DNA (cytosine-5)-methyltransferase 1
MGKACKAAQRAAPTTKAKAAIKVGSACTGWASEAQALHFLGIPCVHEFGCDIAAASRAFCTANFDFKQWYSNVFDKDFKGATSVDIFSAGFPCQPYAADGARKGCDDERSQVIDPILQYVRRQRPRAVILENVLGFLYSTHRAVRGKIERNLRRSGYVIHMGVLNSINFGVPQNRSRVYYVCLRSDIKGSDAFQWPKESKPPALSRFLDKGVSLPTAKSLRSRILATATAIKRQCDMEPCDARIIIDAANGRGPHYMVGMSPTIARSRGCDPKAYVDTKMMNFLILDGIIRLQGSDPAEFDFSMLARTAAGELAGNAMAVSVMKALLPNVIKAIQ